MSKSEQLGSWNDTPTRAALVAFAETAAQTVPPEERVAVFDNDGTLWCEKPMPIELGFILQRLAAMAERDESLRGKQPWQAAYEKDYAWLGGVVEKHYAGDDTEVKVLLGGILQAFAGQTVDEYASAAAAFLEHAPHPTLGRRLRDCAYVPMVELLRFLESHGFTSFIASGGSRDFMRTVTHELYGIPPQRVIGSSNGLQYTDDEHGGSLSYLAQPDVFDDGPGQAGADLEPHRPPPDRRRGKLERRHPDAPLRGRQGPARTPAARPPRRCRARVRRHQGCGEGARAGAGGGLDGRQHRERLVDRLRGLGVLVLVELRQVVRDLEPRRLRADEDVLRRPQARRVDERAERDVDVGALAHDRIQQ